MCKLKERKNKGHYDVQIKVWMKKGGIMICNLKGRMGK